MQLLICENSVSTNFSKASNLSSSVKLCNLLGKVSTWFHLNRFSPSNLHEFHPSIILIRVDDANGDLWFRSQQLCQSMNHWFQLLTWWAPQKGIDKTWVKVHHQAKKRTIIIQGKKFKRISRFGSQWWLHECCICLGLSPCTSRNILSVTRPLQFDFV